MNSTLEFDESKIHIEDRDPGDPPWFGPRLSYRLPNGEDLMKTVMLGYDESPDFSEDEEDHDEDEYDEVQGAFDFAVWDIKNQFHRRVSRLTAHERIAWLKAVKEAVSGTHQKQNFGQRLDSESV